MEYPKAIIKQTSKHDFLVFSPDELYSLGSTGEFWGPVPGPRISIRSGGNFVGMAYYLASGYDWTVAVDDEGQPILIPSRKK